MRTHYPVLIAGGGTAGITVAARLASQPTPPEMAIIEPSTKHYYQPLWTLVGAGVFPKEDSVRDEADFIPHGVDWIQDYVAAFDPDNNRVVLRSGTALTYDYLVVALGIQVDWDKIPGLQEALAMRNGVCSNYAYETVDRTWENIRTLKRGVAVFTQPSTTIKCGGAPQKIAYLADDHFRRAGVRDQITIKFFSGQASIFSVEKLTPIRCARFANARASKPTSATNSPPLTPTAKRRCSRTSTRVRRRSCTTTCCTPRRP